MRLRRRWKWKRKGRESVRGSTGGPSCNSVTA